MRIVRATSGVDAVVVHQDGIVFIDPGLSHEEAAVAIWNAMPDVEPILIRRWLTMGRQDAVRSALLVAAYVAVVTMAPAVLATGR